MVFYALETPILLLHLELELLEVLLVVCESIHYGVHVQRYSLQGLAHNPFHKLVKKLSVFKLGYLASCMPRIRHQDPPILNINFH